MENHHITSKSSEMSNANAPRNYYCNKCGREFGRMPFDASQLIDISGCPGVLRYKEPAPSPFWVNGEVSKDDVGHEALVKDLYLVYQEAEQYQFHDSKNKKYAMPKVALVSTLEKIIQRVKQGYYDNHEQPSI